MPELAAHLHFNRVEEGGPGEGRNNIPWTKTKCHRSCSPTSVSELVSPKKNCQFLSKSARSAIFRDRLETISRNFMFVEVLQRFSNTSQVNPTTKQVVWKDCIISSRHIIFLRERESDEVQLSERRVQSVRSDATFQSKKVQIIQKAFHLQRYHRSLVRPNHFMCRRIQETGDLKSRRIIQQTSEKGAGIAMVSATMYWQAQEQEQEQKRE